MARKDIWEKKRKWPVRLAYLVAILVLGYIAYSVYYYLSTAEKIEEFNVCYQDKCIKTYHIHMTINFELCGREINLPLETGPLESSHTHKERNYIHFHERLPYDNLTGKILDNSPLQMGTLMNNFDIRFNERCIANYCSGDPCPDGKPGEVRMFVNGQPNIEFDKYVWNDEDEVLITFE